MLKTRYSAATAILLAGSLALLSACGDQSPGQAAETPGATAPPIVESSPSVSPSPSMKPEKPEENKPEPTPSAEVNQGGQAGSDPADDAVQVAATPEAMSVLVNKQFKLPDGYKPDDLVEPDVHFIFSEKLEKRLMRKEAAEALELLFEGAKKDGYFLGGVSGYRSHEYQTSLFNRYVKQQGEEEARKVSAVPGHSEHQTGLAMDVSDSSGKCAAEDCFADMKESQWLAGHAHEYGFIIRYPKGKEEITGYSYEPWHIRYVGTDIAKEIYEQGITLEEYYNTIPVSAQK
ncbi:D-alanyl-D-alanine carboxypeptidase family protein [Paenibacillus sp. J2TS4]|uniref:M15 family metallopeptidase n=1 Tax=Paenibacillus sp. J2TS4 TaxID=2807194 RepID=UPI001B07562C|nr:M15 family metallopeptidase [Paenibacillus sp. J2TS4]GIP31941.1 putative carboxypeptidase YodJ [Paenibacillus sp. J2TS4]